MDPNEVSLIHALDNSCYSSVPAILGNPSQSPLSNGDGATLQQLAHPAIQSSTEISYSSPASLEENLQTSFLEGNQLPPQHAFPESSPSTTHTPATQASTSSSPASHPSTVPSTAPEPSIIICKKPACSKTFTRLCDYKYGPLIPLNFQGTAADIPQPTLQSPLSPLRLPAQHLLPGVRSKSRPHAAYKHQA